MRPVDSTTTSTLDGDNSSLEGYDLESYHAHARLSNIEDQDELDELNENLRRTFSIQDALELRSVDNESIRSGGNISNLPEVEKIFTNKSTGDLNLPPDGGYGWVNVFCFTLIQFSTWGANAGSTSVLLAFYIDNDVFKTATRLDFAWIAGIILGLGQSLTPFALILSQTFGLKKIMFIAAVLNLVGYILSAEAKEIWHLYLSQGVLTGLVFAPMFAPMGTVIPKWFLKKRGLATGFALSGTGLGGLVYSFATNAMISRTGDQKWALRMVGISSFAGALIAILLVRDNPPNFEVSKREKASFSSIKQNFLYMFQLSILKDKRFYFLIFWFDCAFFGYLLLVYSFTSYATALGYSQSQGSYLGAIINAAQVVGRPFMGFIADRFVGRVNYSIVLGVVCTIFILAFWINAKTYGALIGVAICFGFTIGVGNVMNMVLIADAFGPALFMSSWAYLNFLNGIPDTFVEVIVLKLRDDTKSNPYLNCQIFVGVIFFASIFGLLPLREVIIKQRLEKERKAILNNISEDKLKTNTDTSVLDEILADSWTAYCKRMFYPKKI